MTVDELVEWVARIFGEDYYDNRDWDDYDAQSKEMFREVAIRVLSHPNLALIDETCYTYKETNKKLAYITPLAEAIISLDK